MPTCGVSGRILPDVARRGRPIHVKQRHYQHESPRMPPNWAANSRQQKYLEQSLRSSHPQTADYASAITSLYPTYPMLPRPQTVTLPGPHDFLRHKSVTSQKFKDSKLTAYSGAAAPQGRFHVAEDKPWEHHAPTEKLKGKLRQLQSCMKDHIEEHFDSVHDAFLHIEMGHKGYITKEEMFTQLRLWNIPTDKQTVDAVFNVIVPDGSNKMNYAAFARCLTHQHMSHQIFGLCDDETGAVHHVTKGIESYGNHMILNTALEVGGAKKVHGSHKHDYREQQLPHAAKGHAKATKEELAAEERMIRQHVDTKFKKMKDAFFMFDEDRDGRITKKELETALRHLNLPVPQEHLDQIIADVDTDHQGNIDYDHFCKKFHENTAQEVDIFGKGNFAVENNLVSFPDPNNTGAAHLHIKRAPVSIRGF